ncbi:hypothetical protein H7B90_23555 [Cohnella xylanilytica]|uniref:Uncharacterized protein n=1 Tax=Cohnella xylanilytica TaxID=557555 RepID=A0A841U0R8_9BACL|nr:hypothetical protein [Cohnella xylanilytica]MBB6694377.1 hypothetical protein [Cohnella xylanilytica]
MASSQSILDDVDLRYRNTFTEQQKLIWFNEEQQELFDVLELDSPPYAFVTVAGENFYPFPDQFDFSKIKTVTMQIDSTLSNPPYVEIPFNRNDFDVDSSWNYWYTIVADAFYLYYAGGVPDAKTIYIYCEADPGQVTTDNINVSPDIPTKYQEILKLGILKRIAMARKDVLMYDNYNADYEQKIQEVLWQRKLKEPEWMQPTDVMPRTGGRQFYGWSPTTLGW